MDNKKTSIFLYFIFTVIMAFFLYMIYIGANGLALTPRKAIFTYKQGETIKTDPGYYFKGVTDPDRVKMDLSRVDAKKPGVYTIQAKQSSRHYEFKIRVTE